MNHLGSRVMSLLLAILFLLGAAGVSFYAVFKGTLVFAADPELNGDIRITKIDGKADGTLTTTTKQTLTLEVTDTDLTTYDTSKLALEFDNDNVLQVSGTPRFNDDFEPTNHTYTITVNVQFHDKDIDFVQGFISDATNSPATKKTFTLDLSPFVPERGANPNTYNLQSYRFYDKDGDLITKLSKGKKIEKLVITIKDGGFSSETYDKASKGDFNASLNYDNFEPRNRDDQPRFSPTATDLPDGCVSYTVTFYDLRYTGESKELQVKIGYPQSFGLERREFTETIPEGDIYEKSSSSSSSSEESSSEVEIDPPTPRLIITSYDYGGQSVAAASTATLNLTFQNVSKRVPVDNVVLKITMPEAFTLTNSSNTFYFERVGREREETISINFTVKPTAEAISQAIKLNFTYETVIANKRTPLTSDEEIAIPVTQINRMTLNPVDAPPEVYIGDNSASIESTFVNKGKTAVYNVTASIEGKNLAQPGQTQFIGNVESGIEKSADFTIEGLEAGPITGEIVLTYEDANMKVTELRTPFTTQAVEMDMGPTQEELDAMNQPQTEPVVSAAWYETIPAWYWAAGGLVGLILLAYLIKLSRVSRLTLLEDDDEDF